MGRIFAFTINNFVISDVLIFSLKRRRTRSQLIQQHSKCPYINPFIILIPLNNLRRYIIDSTAKCLSLTKYKINYTKEANRWTIQNQTF